MAYIGQDPVIGRYIIVDQISGGFNGTASGFTLAAGGQGVIPGLAQNVLLSLGGVIQQPGTDYTVSGSGITFTTPPLSGTTFFATVLGDVQAVGTPSDGTVLPASIATSGTFVFPNITTTGTTLIASGNASTPSLAVIGDTNTGLYSPGADQLSITTGGTERFRIDSAGQLEAVSLGTAAAPTFSFTTDPNTGIYSPGADQLAISTAGSGRLFVDASGNVGINGSPTTAGNPYGYRELSIKGAAVDRSGVVRLIDSAGTSNGVFYANDTAGLVIENSLNRSISFWTNTSEKMRLDSSGRLGVGTSAPVASLQIGSAGSTGASAATNQLFGDYSTSAQLRLMMNNTSNYFGIGTNGGSSMIFGTSAANAGTSPTVLMTLTSGGSLGIGTSSPSAPLHVSGTGILVNGQTTATLNLNGSAYGMVSAGADLYLETAGAGNQVIFRRGGTESARFDASGRLGIGTTSPVSLLHVNAATGITYATIGNGSGGTQIGVDASGLSVVSTYAANAIRFGNSSGSTFVETARLDSSGRLLVGTSTARTNYFPTTSGVTPNVQLEASRGGLAILGTGDGSDLFIGKGSSVTAADDFLGEICFTGFDGTNNRTAARILCQTDAACGSGDMPGRLVFSTTADGAASPTESFRITNAGRNIFNRLGTPTDTDFVVQVFADSTVGGVAVQTNQSGARTAIRFRNPNGIIGEIITNGSATAYNTSSDYRLKENVVPLTGAVDRVNQLQVRRFNFIADPDHTVDGFIAHEAQDVVPECVTGTKDAVDADGNPVYQGIDQSKLVPLLTAALQEAIGEIESLKARVVALEGA